MWTHQQLEYLKLLEIPIWLSKEQSIEVADDTTPAVALAENEAAQAAKIVAKTAVDRSAEMLDSLMDKGSKAERLVTENVQPENTETTINEAEAAGATEEAEPVEEKPSEHIACYSFASEKLVLLCETHWQKPAFSAEQQYLLRELVQALVGSKEEGEQIIQSYDFFRWPPNEGGLFKADETIEALQEYSQRFEQPLCIILGERLAQLLAEMPAWDVADIADSYYIALPDISHFIQQPMDKKRLWQTLQSLIPAIS